MSYHAQLTSIFKCNSYYILVPSSICINIDFSAHGTWLVLLVNFLFQLSYMAPHLHFPTQIPTTTSGLQQALASHPAALKGHPCPGLLAFFQQVDWSSMTLVHSSQSIFFFVTGYGTDKPRGKGLSVLFLAQGKLAYRIFTVLTMTTVLLTCVLNYTWGS